MTFEDTAIECDQSFVLHPDTTGQIEYLTKYKYFYCVIVYNIVFYIKNETTLNNVTFCFPPLYYSCIPLQLNLVLF